MGVMDLFSLGAAGDLGPDAQCIADWVLQSFSLTCTANEWKPQTGAPGNARRIQLADLVFDGRLPCALSCVLSWR